MTPFIQTLFTMTGTATIAALCVMVLRIPLKKAPRWITCALWLVVFLRMVCPVILDLPVSLMPAQVTSGAAAERVLPAPAPTPLEPAEAVTEPPLESSKVVEPTEPMAPTPNGPDRYEVLTLIWTAGAAGMGLWAVASYSRLRRRVADGVLVSENVYETDQVDSPFVCGFFNPRIYLPVGLAEEDKAYVLLHEQAHLRRRDHWTKPLFWLALCIHWFNPVLWLAYRLFCRDVESACDQAVVKTFDKAHTAGYAAALLHLGRKPSLPQAVPLAFGEEDAKGRIQGVLNYRKPALWVVTAAVVLCAAVGVLLVGTSENRLDGHTVTDSCTWADGYPVHFPEELQQEAIQLLKPYLPTKKEIPLPEESPYGRNRLTQLECDETSPRRGYLLYESDDGICLLYTESIGEQFTEKNYLLAHDFTAKYDAWMQRLEEFLWVSRPDVLYAKRSPLSERKDAETFLDNLHFWQLLGNYNITLDTTSEPYGLSIQLQRIPGLWSQQQDLQEYLRLVSLCFQSLATNTNPITWSRENPLGDWAMVPSYKDSAQTKEEFRQLYAQMESAASRLRQATSWYRPSAVLYLCPDLPTTDSQEDLVALYQYSGWGIQSHSFSADLATGTGDSYQLLTKDRYADDPLYDCRALPDVDFPAEARLDLSRYQNKHYTIVNDSQGRDTGYRVYELDQDLFLAHYKADGTLEYLFQLTLEV